MAIQNGFIIYKGIMVRSHYYSGVLYFFVFDFLPRSSKRKGYLGTGHTTKKETVIVTLIYPSSSRQKRMIKVSFDLM